MPVEWQLLMLLLFFLSFENVQEYRKVKKKNAVHILILTTWNSMPVNILVFFSFFFCTMQSKLQILWHITLKYLNMYLFSKN